MSVTVFEHAIPSHEDGAELEFAFESEALGMPSSLGYGYAQLKFGEAIGPDSRYTVLRKLGWGRHSSVWLARDARDKSFIAVKVLTGSATATHLSDNSYEPAALNVLNQPPASPHCPRILDQFTMPGRGSAGQHHCMVMPLYGGDVRTLHRTESAPLPLLLAKRILLHVVRALARAHSCKVIHTDLKSDNILYTTPMTTADIEKLLQDDPSRYHPPEKFLDGMVQSAVSQPLPTISREQALHATFVLADFGLSQPFWIHPDIVITIPPLRPPEVILGGKWDESAEIWSLGVLAYDLITSHPLFLYQVNKKWGLTEDENMLYQMINITGEIFYPKQLQPSVRAPEFFNAVCELKKKPDLAFFPFEYSVPAYGNVADEDVPVIAAFLRRCLHLYPPDRATASELLTDPFFAGVDDSSM